VGVYQVCQKEKECGKGEKSRNTSSFGEPQGGTSGGGTSQKAKPKKVFNVERLSCEREKSQRRGEWGMQLVTGQRGRGEKEEGKKRW